MNTNTDKDATVAQSFSKWQIPIYSFGEYTPTRFSVYCASKASWMSFAKRSEKAILLGYQDPGGKGYGACPRRWRGLLESEEAVEDSIVIHRSVFIMFNVDRLEISLLSITWRRGHGDQTSVCQNCPVGVYQTIKFIRAVWPCVYHNPSSSCLWC